MKRRRPLTVPSFLPTGSSYTTPTQRPAGRSAHHQTVSARAFKDSTDTCQDSRRAPRVGADSEHRRRGHAPGRSSPRKAISPAMPSTSTRSPTVIGAAIIPRQTSNPAKRKVNWHVLPRCPAGAAAASTQKTASAMRHRGTLEAHAAGVCQPLPWRGAGVCVRVCMCVLCTIRARTCTASASRGAGVHVRARLR